MLALLSAIATGCADLRYLAHVAHGQLQLASQRRSLDEVIASPTTDAALAARLSVAKRAREFAVRRLGLPDNRSYTYYVDLHRPYVVWNVFATPRYSIAPVLHCFPIAGCVPYRGYFDESLANAEGARLQAQDDDVFVGGVAAYSTLGWFADPILSSMLRWDDDELIGTIFHELAHQLIYVKDDSAFNESFASFVQQQGLREWLQASGQPLQNESDDALQDGFVHLVLDLRERLRQLYATGIATSEMEAAKQRAFEDFRQRYQQWRKAQPPDHQEAANRSRDAFVAAPLNNAQLLPFGLYDRWTPAFASLFARSQSRWADFYTRVRALAKESKHERERSLDALLPIDAPNPPQDKSM